MLINSREILKKAKEGKYAVPQFNINNLEWTKIVLERCEVANKPVILGVSEGALKYMGGPVTVTSMVKGLIEDLNITVPVVLHLDHGGSFEMCKKVIDAGFTSVMIDASKYPLEENIAITRQVVEYAHNFDVTVEAEVGHIGGTEDNVSATSLNATLEDCLALVNGAEIDSIAPALGSVHGLYKGDPNLDFETMAEINKSLTIPLVLHGGTGIPDYDIRKAIECGISKININTELQIAWHNGVKEFINNNPDAYDPRKVIGGGKEKMITAIDEKIKLFFTVE
jgi:fructose-1,6-bisphosphate aldolase, class II, various bacterial and amitochondriate protist